MLSANSPDVLFLGHTNKVLAYWLSPSMAGALLSCCGPLPVICARTNFAVLHAIWLAILWVAEVLGPSLVMLAARLASGKQG